LVRYGSGRICDDRSQNSELLHAGHHAATGA
jgi:hypothetical protein